MKASHHGRTAVVDMLLSRGANTDMADNVWELYYSVICNVDIDMAVIYYRMD